MIFEFVSCMCLDCSKMNTFYFGTATSEFCGKVQRGPKTFNYCFCFTDYCNQATRNRSHTSVFWIVLIHSMCKLLIICLNHVDLDVL